MKTTYRHSVIQFPIIPFIRRTTAYSCSLTPLKKPYITHILGCMRIQLALATERWDYAIRNNREEPRFAQITFTLENSAVLASTPPEPAVIEQVVIETTQGATYSDYDECQHEYDRRDICILCGYDIEDDIEDTDFIDAGITPAPHFLDSPPLTVYQADYESGFLDARAGG